MEDTEQKKAYKEILVILEELELKNDIPKDLIDMFEKEQDVNWNFNLEKDKPLEEQNLMKETTNLLSVLYMTYICKDKKEQKELIKSYEKTQEEKDKKYLENLFERKKEKQILDDKVESENKSDLVISKTKLSTKLKNILINLKKFFQNIFKTKK